jgi:hypothetical protein
MDAPDAYMLYDTGQQLTVWNRAAISTSVCFRGRWLWQWPWRGNWVRLLECIFRGHLHGGRNRRRIVTFGPALRLVTSS